MMEYSVLNIRDCREDECGGCQQAFKLPDLIGNLLHSVNILPFNLFRWISDYRKYLIQEFPVSVEDIPERFLRIVMV